MESGSVLVDLFALFAAAKILGELFEYARQPPVVGELLGGIVVGPHALGLVGADSEPFLAVLAELGVIILLFTVGLETSLGELRRVGRPALFVGVAGAALPFAAGGALTVALGYSRGEVLFVAAAMMATSVGVTARTLRDLGAVRTAVARVVLGAAVVDDILAILVLALVAGLTVGNLSEIGLVLTVLEVAVFLVIVVAAGPRVVRRVSELTHLPVVPGSPFVFAVLLTLGLAALSEVVGLAAIIGAFLAGLIIEIRREEIAGQVQPVYELLVPFFFAFTGSRLDPTVFAQGAIIGLIAGVTVLAVLTKLAGGYAGAVGLGRRARLAVGVGMVPRGEVGLIVASLGIGLGVIGQELFGVVVGMTVLTTIATPPVLAPIITRLRRTETGPAERGRRGDTVEG